MGHAPTDRSTSTLSKVKFLFLFLFPYLSCLPRFLHARSTCWGFNRWFIDFYNHGGGAHTLRMRNIKQVRRIENEVLHSTYYTHHISRSSTYSIHNMYTYIRPPPHCRVGWMDGWREVFLMRSSRASDSDSLSANWTRWGGEEKLGPLLLYSWCCLHNDGVLNGSNMKYLEHTGKKLRGLKRKFYTG